MRCTDKDALIDNIESIVQEYSHRYGTLDDRMMLVLRIRDMVRDAPQCCFSVSDKWMDAGQDEYKLAVIYRRKL